ncbi:hypothetical protein HDU96_000990 [Phlyctochytrium bullatum]|nr:hypothetical protein HDU96_000990 [Phlyctochytrium bullatum]
MSTTNNLAALLLCLPREVRQTIYALIGDLATAIEVEWLLHLEETKPKFGRQSVKDGPPRIEMHDDWTVSEVASAFTMAPLSFAEENTEETTASWNLRTAVKSSAYRGWLEVLQRLHEQRGFSVDRGLDESKAAQTASACSAGDAWRRLRECTKLAPSTLMNAAFGGHFEVVKYLHSCGVLVTTEALQAGAVKGHLDICRYLLETDGTVVTDFVMASAASSGNFEPLSILADKLPSRRKGWDLRKAAALAALLLAREEVMEKAQGILSNGSLPSDAAHDFMEIPRMHHVVNDAVRCGKSDDIVFMLMEKGILYSWQALHHAVSRGRLKVVMHLLADTNEARRRNARCTPSQALNKAALFGQKEIAAAILEAYPGIYPRGALETAVRHGHVDVALLVQALRKSTPHSRISGLKKAAKGGDVKAVMAYLAAERFAQQQLADAATLALAAGHLEAGWRLVEAHDHRRNLCMLPGQQPMLYFVPNHCLVQVAAAGHHHIMQYILSGRIPGTSSRRPPLFSDTPQAAESLHAAACAAARKGYVDVLATMVELDVKLDVPRLVAKGCVRAPVDPVWYLMQGLRDNTDGWAVKAPFVSAAVKFRTLDVILGMYRGRESWYWGWREVKAASRIGSIASSEYLFRNEFVF